MSGPKKISQFTLAEGLTDDDFVAGIKKVGTDAYDNVKIPVSMLLGGNGDFSSMFELVTPEVGNPYIKAKLDFMSVGEITAYAAGGVGNIWDNMPVATATTLGGIKVGESLTINNGVLNVNGDTFNLTNYYTKSQTDTLLSAKFDKAGGSISGNVSIAGNLTVLGTEFIADVQTVQIADNLAVINYGETGNGVTAGFSGWEIDRGTATNYRFGFTESVGYFQVGKTGSLQTVATREDVPLANGFARWNGTAKRFDTVVINNIVTGTGTAGQISYWDGTGSQTGSVSFTYDAVNRYVVIGNFSDARLQIAKSSVGTSAFLGGGRYGDGTSNTYRMYLGYDIYWNDNDRKWYAERTTLGNKFVQTMGYHDNAVVWKYYNGGGSGSLASGWADSDMTELMRINGNGNVLIGTTTDSGYKLNVNGSIRAAGNIYATGNITGAGEVTAYTASDARLKTNITSLASINALDIINQLNPVTYTWNSKAVQLNPNKNTTTISYGLIAQELEQVVPDLIRPIYGDYKTYDDRGLMTIMLQAIKELKSKVDRLENKN